jgi:RND family efflux transporter MFP subunit
LLLKKGDGDEGLRFRPAYLLAIILIAAAIGAFLWFNQPSMVDAARPTVGPAVDVVYATGFVEPREPVEVASRVTAPIVRVLVTEGQHVTRGQPLVTLESNEQLQAIDELAARAANAAVEEERAVALHKRGFLASAARDRAVSAARSARAAERVARARLNQFVIRAGISGIVLRRDVEPGDLASPTKTLMLLGDPTVVRITATVDERDIPRVRVGQRALMSSDAFQGRVFRGIVYQITPGGDPNQRAFRVRISPDEVGALPVGMTLEVNVITASRPRALLVPATAIRDGYVWTVRGGRAVRISVKTGVEGAQRREIRQGLDRSACVVVDPPEGLKEGDRLGVEGC